MSKKNKISVITISYNQGEYIEETLLSVFNQNYENLEYVVIDGGSTDNTLEILKKYKDKLSYWVSEPDKGPADALNKGFDKATGDILYYLNSDDLIRPGMLDYFNDLYNKNNDFDVYYGHCIIELPQKKYFKSYSDKWDTELFLKGQITTIQPSTFFKGTFFRKSKLKFNLDNSTCWDGELLVDAALNKARFYRFNQYASVFRLYPESISGGNNEKRNQTYKRNLEVVYNKIRAAGHNDIKTGYLGLKISKFLRDPIVMIKRQFAFNNKALNKWKNTHSKPT